MEKFSFSNQPRLRYLTDEQIKTVHEKALYVLETAGAYYDSEEALKILHDNGAKVDFAKKIARFSAGMVMDAIKAVPGAFQLYDREGNPSVMLDGSNVHFDPGSAAIRFLESDGITVRNTEAGDLVKISKLNDAMENIALQSTAITPYDIPKMIGDSYRIYLLLKNSGKSIVSGAFTVEGIKYMHDMMAAVCGGADNLRNKPIAVFDICSSPALKWTHISCQNIIDCARLGLPIETISVPMFGAVSPATLAGSLILHISETLSGIVLAQSVVAGSKMIFGGAPMNFDMRFNTTSLNSIESEMVSVGYSQMAKYYGMPCHTYAGLADSKTVDAQAGFETGMSAELALLGGVNIISGAGVMDFCNTFSLEKLVIDNEICGYALRSARGIEFSDEKMAVDLICELGPGGDYMSSEHTLKWFKKEPYIPSQIVDRRSRENWADSDGKDIYGRARVKVAELMQDYKPRALEPEREEALNRVQADILKKSGYTGLPFAPQM